MAKLSAIHGQHPCGLALSSVQGAQRTFQKLISLAPEEPGEFWEEWHPGRRLVPESQGAGLEAKPLEYSRPGSPTELGHWLTREKAGLDEEL